MLTRLALSDTFSRNLVALREKRGLTRKALAARAGITEAGLSLLERSKRLPSWEVLISLVEVLNVTVSDLIRVE